MDVWNIYIGFLYLRFSIFCNNSYKVKYFFGGYVFDDYKEDYKYYNILYRFYLLWRIIESYFLFYFLVMLFLRVVSFLKFYNY